MKALDNAEIDAIATPQLSNNYNYATIIDYGFCDYYFAVAKDKTDILSELNEALYEIQSSDPNYNAVLQIRMGYLDNNLPYSDLDDNGNFIGVLNALTETMQDNFNINIKVYCYNNHTELYSAFLNGEIDAIGPSYSDLLNNMTLFKLILLSQVLQYYFLTVTQMKMLQEKLQLLMKVL